LKAAAAHYGFAFDPDQPVREYGEVQRDLFLYGVEGPQFRRHFPGVEPPATAKAGRFEGVVPGFMRRYAERIEDQKYREKMERFIYSQPCPDCGGQRLGAESRAVTVVGRTIIALSEVPLSELADWVEALPDVVGQEEWGIIEPIMEDLRTRMHRILRVGLGYLTMERSSPSLSYGEGQRLRLAVDGRSGDAAAAGEARDLARSVVAEHPWDVDVRVWAADVEALLRNDAGKHAWIAQQLARFPADRAGLQQAAAEGGIPGSN
jgi:excinuclease UvrABC ATPase subunit